MDAFSLNSVVNHFVEGLANLESSQNAMVFAEEYNRILDVAKSVFPKEQYVQSFQPLKIAETQDKKTLDSTLEMVRMKAGLLKAYVFSEVTKEKRETHVY